MISRRARIIAVWLACIAGAALAVVHARYVTDLSAFLPARPTAMQRLLVDQLREGPSSRLILVALEQGEPKTRAELSLAMARRLRIDREFSSINDGEQIAAKRDREFLFRRRYLLSEAVRPQRFTASGLEQAIEQTLEGLASPEGLLLKSLVRHDPTGEMLQVMDQLSRIEGPRTRDGVWVSADGERTLLVAEIAAAGSDTDAVEHALDAIRSAFTAATRTTADPGTRDVQLRMSGPGVFAVAARAKIKGAVVRLSIISSSMVVVLLLLVYRSLPALILGLLPVASGALIGIAAVALGFGAVHGITLGFGITLIGESVDYSIYFFIQSSSGAASQQRLWPTIRLGMLTSVCGFASLLPSGFPGLAQLGAYSISGLLAAAAVTRFVLPELKPSGLAIRDLTPFGARLAHLQGALRRLGTSILWSAALAIAAAAVLVLYRHHGTLWNRELSALSPVPVAALDYDAELRADLGVANVLDLVVVSGGTLESVLRGAERTGESLLPLVDEKVIGGFDSPTNFLPSRATQEARRSSLPAAAILRENLRQATAGLALDGAQLTPFIDDVEAARQGTLITPEELRDTSLAAGFGALILHQSDHWNALLPLHAADPAMQDIDFARIDEALAGAAQGEAAAPGTDAGNGGARAQLLDLKKESDALYESYLKEAIRLSLAGLAIIVALLWVALRSPQRVARVLAPLILAVLTVAAALALGGRQLTILHLVGMLLIVAIGSNYALFFDAHRSDAPGSAPLTLASLAIANLSTVIAFGLLSFSGVPVLEALGSTVAPGAFLALLYAAILTPPPDRRMSLGPQTDA
jgi:predicted exporter